VLFKSRQITFFEASAGYRKDISGEDSRKKNVSSSKARNTKDTKREKNYPKPNEEGSRYIFLKKPKT